MRASPPALALSLGFAIAMASAVPAPAEAGDIILLNSGKKAGKADASIPPTADDYANSNIEAVLEENIDTIRYKLEGVPTIQSYKTEDVKEVYHDPGSVPRELRDGRGAMREGKYAEGRELLDRVVRSSAAPKWAQDAAAFDAARSYWDEGDLDAAIKAFGSFAANHGKSRMIGEAVRLRARGFMALGKADEARAEFEKFKTIPGMPQSERLMADFSLANIDLAQALAGASPDKNLLKQAKNKYTAILTQVGNKPELTRVDGLCRVGIATCDLNLGDIDDAQQRLEKLIAASDDQLILAGSYTQLGNALLRKNLKARDRAVFEKALMHFLRVVTLYGEDPEADPHTAEAMFHAGELFAELRPANPTTDEEKEAYRQGRLRAVREFDDCARRFPNSSWARRASQARAQLR